MKRKMILLVMLLLIGFSSSNGQYGPVVSFTYDDGSSNWYDIGFPVFQEYGFPGVVYINALNWWVSGNGYGAVDKLIEMQAAGWEVSSHTYDHQGIDSLNVSLMKNWLDSLGFPNSGFAGPGHVWDHSLVDIIKRYHLYYSATNTDGGISQPFDLYFIQRSDLTNVKTIEEVRGFLDDAVENNKWIIFYAHDFGGTYGDGSGWYQCEELLRMTFDEIVEREIPVKTVSEVITDLFPPGCVIECSVDSLQDPVLTYFEEGGGSFNTDVWNEYWHNTFHTEPRFVGSPAVYCHTSNDSLPVMKFCLNVPDGEYEVVASIIAYDPGRTYRLYYSFDSVNTSQYNVEVNENSEVSLGTVTITNGQFALYTQKADAVTGGDGYVGWAFVKLFAQSGNKFVQTNVKTFLQGNYINGTMTTSLNSSGMIPLNQPYNVAPWNYTGIESVENIPVDIVDWILLELRTGIEATTTVAKRAAFLKSDGSIVDLNGSSQVRFEEISSGSFYIVIRHRNHLPIMSANPVALFTTDADLFDLTTDLGQAYGTDAMKDLGGGHYGMYSADGNRDGGIYGEDYIHYQTSQGEEGYRIEDYNLDGGVYGEDYILYQLNQGFESYVP